MPAVVMSAPPVEVPGEIHAADLRYVNDTMPGIRRVRAGKKSFRFVGVNGRPIQNEDELRRIRALVIPPAWTDVWICPEPRGHIQATGHDARGRKQYRYHQDWRRVRDETKYTRMIAFGRALPSIRNQVERDLARPGVSRNTVLALVVNLLETTCIRIGNEEYARENKSYGLTTFLDHHAEFSAGKATFSFQGKSGVKHKIDVRGRRLVKLIKQCQDLPGQELFQYEDDEGQVRDIDSADVNEYIQEITGQDFTAKDFRTWRGTVMAATHLQELGAPPSAKHAKRHVVRAVEQVANTLGNTKTVCRKSYIHPAVIDAYLDGSLHPVWERGCKKAHRAAKESLTPEEHATLDILEAHQRGDPLKRQLEASLRRKAARR
ncbi:DNA topoisomerase I [Planctomycetaceae bacterium SCGC AG-212-F19]|nr:DNA topoisomerase I [Planctomycetaceae bacterium SCGC AG-212-F19]